jgi:hypothetical protein
VVGVWVGVSVGVGGGVYPHIGSKLPLYVRLDGVIPVINIDAVSAGPVINTLFAISADSSDDRIVNEKS